MSQVTTLADQLERSFHGGAWHGPSVTEALAGVDATAAAAHPLAGAHSIWEIVRHLTAWNEIPLRRIEGERLEGLSQSQDWPSVGDVSPEAWRAALAALAEAHAALQARVRALTDAQLDDPVGGSDPTVRGLLFGVVQHHAYHAGQIVLLRKAVAGVP
ncbi:MAG TPA: DinB family protein [Thermoanaerobaculia bacterium]|jgi:uncharacterized damage-inducible protein DinB|nr:DinB family protein [Thermoanaerobaculia bacterium]